MFERCEEQKLVDGNGFPPTLEVHDLAYNLLPDVVSKMYAGKVADKVMVCNRNFEIYYDTDVVKNPTPQGIRQGIYKARQSYVSRNGLEHIRLSWKKVEEMMKKRNHSEEEYVQMRKCYEAFIINSGIDNKQNTNVADIVFILQQTKTPKKL